MTVLSTYHIAEYALSNEPNLCPDSRAFEVLAGRQEELHPREGAGRGSLWRGKCDTTFSIAIKPWVWLEKIGHVIITQFH